MRRRVLNNRLKKPRRTCNGQVIGDVNHQKGFFVRALRTSYQLQPVIPLFGPIKGNVSYKIRPGGKTTRFLKKTSLVPGTKSGNVCVMQDICP